MTDTVVGVVRHVAQGKHGPYAVAHNDSLKGSITFALSKPCWNETSEPKSGELVVLSNLRRKRAGWRALKARFYQPTDEQKGGTTKK